MTAYNASAQPQIVKDNESFQAAKVTMIKAHMQYMVFNIFRTRIKQINFKDKRITQHMTLLCKILAIDNLLTQGGVVFDSGFFAQGSYQHLQQAFQICASELRPQMLNLTEAQFFPDDLLPSVIGNQYGDIYEAQMEWARNSRFNKHNKDNIPPHFNELIKPVL